jgi:hypothetical protein
LERVSFLSNVHPTYGVAFLEEEPKLEKTKPKKKEK